MSYSYASYEKKGRIAYVTINRPEVLNALSDSTHRELAEIFQDFKNDDESWIAILSGAGERAFSAGSDIKPKPDAPSKGDRTQEEHPPYGGIATNFECYKPIIAAVNGFALGGGLEVVLACDIVIAAEHARFGLPEPRIGVMAPFGGLQRLPRRVPFNLAMGMILTGKQITAQEAYRIGLVNEVVPLADLIPAAERWANQILECSPISVRISKESVLMGQSYPVEEAIKMDIQRSRRIAETEDRLEGRRAFAEKRKPQWKGR